MGLDVSKDLRGLGRVVGLALKRVEQLHAVAIKSDYLLFLIPAENQASVGGPVHLLLLSLGLRLEERRHLLSIPLLIRCRAFLHALVIVESTLLERCLGLGFSSHEFSFYVPKSSTVWPILAPAPGPELVV